MHAFKFSLLAVLVWVFLRFNRPHAECAPIMRYCALKYLRSEMHKHREILSHTSVFKFKI